MCFQQDANVTAWLSFSTNLENFPRSREFPRSRYSIHFTSNLIIQKLPSCSLRYQLFSQICSTPLLTPTSSSSHLRSNHTAVLSPAQPLTRNRTHMSSKSSKRSKQLISFTPLYDHSQTIMYHCVDTHGGKARMCLDKDEVLDQMREGVECAITRVGEFPGSFRTEIYTKRTCHSCTRFTMTNNDFFKICSSCKKTFCEGDECMPASGVGVCIQCMTTAKPHESCELEDCPIPTCTTIITWEEPERRLAEARMVAFLENSWWCEACNSEFKHTGPDHDSCARCHGVICGSCLTRAEPDTEEYCFACYESLIREGKLTGDWRSWEL